MLLKSILGASFLLSICYTAPSSPDATAMRIRGNHNPLVRGSMILSHLKETKGLKPERKRDLGEGEYEEYFVVEPLDYGAAYLSLMAAGKVSVAEIGFSNDNALCQPGTLVHTVHCELYPHVPLSYMISISVEYIVALHSSLNTTTFFSLLMSAMFFHIRHCRLPGRHRLASVNTVYRLRLSLAALRPRSSFAVCASTPHCCSPTYTIHSYIQYQLSSILQFSLHTHCFPTATP
jgi:hypothetical protein